MRVPLADHRDILDHDVPGAPPAHNNLHMAIANVPPLAESQRAFIRQISEGIDPRERELVILQFAALSRNDYCWGHHVRLGVEAGVREQEIADIYLGDASNFSPREQALLTLVRTVHDRAVDDHTWATAAGYFGQDALIRIVMLAGFYSMMTVVRDALGVPLDEGLSGFAVT